MFTLSGFVAACPILKNIMGKLSQLPKDHSLSNELSVLYNKLLLKEKSMEQIADLIKNWLIIMQNNDNQEIESSLATLKAHTDCGQCFWQIGFFYAHGIETETDLGQAVQWYKKAAEQGHANAQFNLAVCYDNGTGVEKDKQKAAVLYQSAVKQAHMSIQVENSRHYSNVSGLRFDIRLLTDFCQSRAKEGNVYAQYMLGLYYENGIGVEADIQRALEFYEKAAEQGYSKAHSKVYTFYKDGLEVKKKIRE